MELAEQILGVLAGFPEISLAILFGSAARNRLTPVSDIDIGVAAARTLAMARKLELHTALARVLPREVDLVDLQAVNGPILQQALSGGVLLKSSPALYAALIKKMWFNQADMLPLTRMVLRRQTRRFVNG